MAAPHRTLLGPLEIAVLDALWTSGPADVVAVHAAVGTPRPVVRNTIQTTLERLVRKGLVARTRRGRAYEYRVAVSREQWTARGRGSEYKRADHRGVGRADLCIRPAR